MGYRPLCFTLIHNSTRREERVPWNCTDTYAIEMYGELEWGYYVPLDVEEDDRADAVASKGNSS